MLGPFIIGLTGLTLSKEDIARIQNPAVGGLILFTRNFESKAQLIDLVESIRSNGGLSKPVFVDHEGGRVQRFRNGFTAIPSMRQIGQRAETDFDDAVLLAREAGFVMAAELRACGIDMSFAPVLDLDWGNSEIIGDRSFGKDARMVSRLSSALMNGMALAGMQACGKHFPGHGYIKADSHLSISEDTRTLDEIESKDMSIFISLIKHGLNAVMPSHVLYSAADNEPAGFSSFWLKNQLREKAQFKGAIFSDDMSMKGAILGGEMKDRIAKALEAGCDMVLLCNSPQLVDEVLAQLDWKMSSESIERLLAMKGFKAPHIALKTTQEKGFKDMTDQVRAM